MNDSAMGGAAAPAGSGDGPATGVGRLAEVLVRANRGASEQLTPVEFAEVLWLAQYVRPVEAPGSAPRSAHMAAETPDSAMRPERAERSRPGSDAGTTSSRPTPAAPGSSGRAAPRVPLHLPDLPRTSGTRTATHTPLLAPAPPLLTHPLNLQRALRPLKRRVPAPIGLELDEAATARLIARLGVPPQWWPPVLRPVAERWLSLRLVYDSGPTMPVWRPLVGELHTALAQSGVFRTVALHRLTAAGTLCGSGARGSCGDGRTVTLLITDCMGPQWRGGAAGNRWYQTLRRWCARMPVAVVQPLPERLWRTTALPAETARIGASWPAAPNSSYDVESYTLERAEHGVFPVPFLEASAPWLGNWSRLVAHAGRFPGSVALLGTVPPPSPVDDQGRGDVGRLSPEELLLRFRSLASPEAFRLAGHLAVGRPRLPVMRLVQAAIERNPQPQHLAEVILSGMLMAAPGPPGSYSFRPGVREVLLRTLPRSARHLTSELLSRIGELIDERAGIAPGTFQVAAPGGTDITTDGRPIAAVREESVRRLGGTVPASHRLLGAYRMVRELGPGSGVWEAVDTHGGQTVAAYRYEVGPNDRGTFLEQARALADVRHPNVVGVHLFGFWDGDAWLVTDFVEGVTLAELTDEGGFRLPYWMLTSVANQVAQCLTAVHGQGLAHGRLTPNCLLLCPDGTVKVTRFALKRSQDTSESKDLDDLGRLLSELLGGPVVPERQEPGDTAGLPRARRAFWERFADAVDDLLSTDLDRQRRGRDLCMSTTYDKQSAAASDPYGYRLLGPVRVTREGHPLPVVPPEEQALLCMLLLRSGRTVTRRELVAGLWGDRLSERQAEREVDRHAARLRNTLGAGILATTPGGYALYATPRTVDMYQCEDLAARARFRREDGENAAARDLVQYALDLWQGEPLEGVPGPAAEATRVRLHALRLDLCTSRAELDLENGDFTQAETDLIALMRSHPTREDFRRLHMLTLSRQGRVEEAVRSYEEYLELVRHGEPATTLEVLYRELLDARGPGRTAITLEISPADEHPRTLAALADTLPRLLSLSGLAADEYEVLGREADYLIQAETEAPAASVLSALGPVMHQLPHDLGELSDPPTVRVTFWQTSGTHRPVVPPDVRAALEGISGVVVVVLSPTLHRELTAGVPPVDASLFRPLHGAEPTAPPLAWYCSVEASRRARTR